MSTALMARKPKRDPKTVANANAILEQYECKNVEDMHDAMKDIFGPMFEAMLGISKGKSYKILREMYRELASKGFLTISGKIPLAYFKEKWYGAAKEVSV